MIDGHYDEAFEVEYFRRRLLHAHQRHAMDLNVGYDKLSLGGYYTQEFTYDGDEHDGAGKCWVCEQEWNEQPLADTSQVIARIERSS